MGGGELRDRRAIGTSAADPFCTDDERPATDAIDDPATGFEVEVRLGAEVSPGIEEAAADATFFNKSV